MADTLDLNGQRILVIEDSYYLASDLARALRRAGAEVLGPYPTEAAALAALDTQRPTCALLDVNLGEGPSFAAATALAARDVPFLFVTGHDETVIPAAFADAERFEKPVDPQKVVGRLALKLGPRRTDGEDRSPAGPPLRDA